MASDMAPHDTDELYGLPLDRFIAERDALARALRGDGQREQAATVARLRKPSVAAWAVNQLARAQAGAMAELFSAGDELREIQSEVLAGRRDAPALRAAAEQERAAVDALIGLARGLLTSEGHELSATVLDRVAETLNAAALDDDARAVVREARLERELRHVGLGAGAPSAPSTGERAVRRGGKRAAGRPGAEEREQRVEAADLRTKPEPAEQRAEARRAERERADARRAARIAEAQARREADRAARALNIARERRERAAEALSEADAALAEAESEAKAAADAHRRAREELDGL